ncbi:MAG TPA: NAD(P)H-dependent oxidoreductase [Kineosporiaceae bacterium]|nr:NAD(P)H-dependent oxidoreductase [Kineosporiaceae bacterium]
MGNPRPASRTAALASAVLDAITTSLDVRPVVREVIDLGALIGELGAPLGAGSAQRYADPLAQLHRAGLAVIATPTYKGSYTGLLKSFLDHVAAGALRGVIAVPVITVGSPAHTLAADVHLRPLLLELGAVTPTAALVVGEQDLADPGGVIASWLIEAAPVLRRLLAPAAAVTGDQARGSGVTGVPA